MVPLILALFMHLLAKSECRKVVVNHSINKPIYAFDDELTQGRNSDITGVTCVLMHINHVYILYMMDLCTCTFTTQIFRKT